MSPADHSEMMDMRLTAIETELRTLGLDLKEIQVQLSERCANRQKASAEMQRDLDALNLRVLALEKSESHVNDELDRVEKQTDVHEVKIHNLDLTLAKWGAMILLLQSLVTAGLIKFVH